MAKQKKLIDYRHPEWSCMLDEWTKWRSVYCGGDHFIDTYVEKYSEREDARDFKRRKKITPSASFAKGVVNEVKNSIFERTIDITRRGGSESYQSAIAGKNGGVDLDGSSMNTFLGTEVLPELLPMKKVGIYIDMPRIESRSVLEAKNKHPYLYVYQAEEIYSWSYVPGTNYELQSVLLRDWIDDCDCDHYLPTGGKINRWRHIWKQDGKVFIQFYDDENNPIDEYLHPNPVPYQLDIPMIPLVILELTDSFLKDISNHQIALTNLESSDIGFLMLSNFPFYTEQYDHHDFNVYGNANSPEDGGADAVNTEREIRVGATHGRRYTKERPGFINPSAENLLASIQKQKALKDDIRSLVQLALSNVRPKMASAESKEIDTQGLQAGLSAIGLELEFGERRIAEIWHAYESHSEQPTITYPARYSLQSDEDRRKDVEELRKQQLATASTTYQKEIAKKIAKKMLAHTISLEDLDKIYAEIDKAPGVTSDAEIISMSVERGILDKGTAAQLLGYPKGVVEKANEEHVERATAIAKAQSDASAARGVPDLSANPTEDIKKEKEASRDTTLDDDDSSKVRGDERK